MYYNTSVITEFLMKTVSCNLKKEISGITETKLTGTLSNEKHSIFHDIILPVFLYRLEREVHGLSF